MRWNQSSVRWKRHYRRGQTLAWTVENAAGESVRIDPRPTFELSDGDAIMRAALNDRGLCQVPSSLARESIDNGDLVPVLEAQSAHEVPVHAVWPATRHLLPKMRLVVDEQLKQAPIWRTR
ncbi:LysR substrate-binding domain-containing protein [Salinisphaera hydrothermalis]|uniref:LysR family transcriptional regulator n=1 Tax=Salinisphaera hydrothermalis (strain C41B8) TaxID=1304275 RepID=A0A084IHL6_SALHC|nr:LysR family transcriptional regulator [Salinisphaera hydrothermalis C41B8]